MAETNLTKNALRLVPTKGKLVLILLLMVFCSLICTWRVYYALFIDAFSMKPFLYNFLFSVMFYGVTFVNLIMLFGKHGFLLLNAEGILRHSILGTEKFTTWNQIDSFYIADTAVWTRSGTISVEHIILQVKEADKKSTSDIKLPNYNYPGYSIEQLANLLNEWRINFSDVT